MKSILVTGATGSFGKQCIKYLLNNNKFKRIIIFSRDEYKQFVLSNELVNHKNYKRLRFFLGDIRDFDRLKLACRDVDVLIHAAALKHVPYAEYNPFEYVKTNVIGTENIVKVAIDQNIKKVVSLSTDKAVSPLNLYGATKLVSDKIIVSANQFGVKNGNCFSVVRYGNVLNSRGSVVPYFKEFIKTNNYFPVTDKKMTRFWIELENCVEFVFSSMEIMIGGEIFIPKIPSVKIIDIAQAINPRIPIKEIGIRPGEKMNEVMITPDDSRSTFEISDRYIIEPEFLENTIKRESILDRLKSHNIKKVALNFSYSSETNTTWLGPEQIKKIL